MAGPGPGVRKLRLSLRVVKRAGVKDILLGLVDYLDKVRNEKDQVTMPLISLTFLGLSAILGRLLEREVARGYA